LTFAEAAQKSDSGDENDNWCVHDELVMFGTATAVDICQVALKSDSGDANDNRFDQLLLVVIVVLSSPCRAIELVLVVA
jgi:hypothetical protein